jgi:serine/threonine protein phosphatase 1
MTGRLFAIGDVHGCARELEALLRSLDVAPGDTVVFVGDYIDRGPDSRRVVELVLELRGRDGARTICLKGNHEDMCLDYLGLGGHYGEAWHANGAAATLRSYGLPPSVGGREAAARLPRDHVAFLESLAPWHQAGGHLFVHAGIRPDRALHEQDEEDLWWIREEFIAHPHPLPYTVVFGHTPQRQVLVDLPYKIGIDTGCVYGNRLTCLELPAATLHQVAAGERQAHRSPLAAEARVLRRA